MNSGAVKSDNRTKQFPWSSGNNKTAKCLHVFYQGRAAGVHEGEEPCSSVRRTIPGVNKLYRVWLRIKWSPVLSETDTFRKLRKLMTDSTKTLKQTLQIKISVRMHFKVHESIMFQKNEMTCQERRSFISSIAKHFSDALQYHITFKINWVTLQVKQNRNNLFIIIINKSKEVICQCTV